MTRDIVKTVKQPLRVNCFERTWFMQSPDIPTILYRIRTTDSPGSDFTQIS